MKCSPHVGNFLGQPATRSHRRFADEGRTPSLLRLPQVLHHGQTDTIFCAVASRQQNGIITGFGDGEPGLLTCPSQTPNHAVSLSITRSQQSESMHTSRRPRFNSDLSSLDIRVHQRSAGARQSPTTTSNDQPATARSRGKTRPAGS